MKLTEKVADDRAFYVSHGPKISSVEELAIALENGNISDESFGYHISNNNNDFVNWINGVYQNEKLAKALKRVKSKETFLKKLKEEMKPAFKPATTKGSKPATKKINKPAAKKAATPAKKTTTKKKK